MKISEYLTKEHCIMDLKASSKEEAITEIAAHLSDSGKVKDKDKFISDILEREKLGSTGIGNKVAIPHSRTDAVQDFVIGFGRSRRGVEFKALDGEPVNLIFVMGANPKELNLYLRLLAELSKYLMNSHFRADLLSASSHQQVIEILKKFERG
ncbi:MAG: PTS sugar transporter subunit IIA [Candidatus Omnitrophota bacterium]|nr:MAG: PTS sugar transporter subunit IIA [Candidatus Omnitrophota bacterium]